MLGVFCARFPPREASFLLEPWIKKWEWILLLFEKFTAIIKNSHRLLHS